MKKIFLKFWPFAAMLVAVAIFFYPVWLQNKVLLPADFVVGTYYPWLDYKWGYPAGVPVKNPITTDVVSFTYPMRTYATQLLKEGKPPLWNPLILNGTPLLANFQSAPFSPTNIFYFLLPKLDAWNWQIIFQPLLGVLFTYFLLRELDRSKSSSIAGGLFFAFGGFMTIWMEWNAHSLVAAFFPLVMLFTLKWLKTGQDLWGTLYSLALALQIFSGYPQIILYEFLILALLIFIFDYKFIRQPKKIIKIILFTLLGFGLASVQILPGLELIKESQRNLESLSSELAFISWHSLVMLFVPDYFGNHSTYNYWGPAHYTIASGYSGIIVLSLAILGLLTFFKQKGISLAISIIGLAVLLGFENPLSVSLQKNNFLGLQAASNQRLLILFNLGFSILAAYGVDHLFEKKLSARMVFNALVLPISVLGGIALYTTLSLNLTQDSNLKIGLRNLAPPFLFLSSAAVLLFLIFKMKSFSRYIIALLIILSVTELFRFGWKFTPFTQKDLVFPTTPVIEYLQSQPKPFRVVASGVIPTNLLMPYGIETVEGYDAVYPLSIAKFLSAVNTNSPDSYLGRYGIINNPTSNLTNLTDTKYLVVSKNTNIDSLRFEKAFEDQSVVILKNNESLPRATLFYDWEIETNKDVLGRLLDKSFPFKEKLILESSPNFKQTRGSGDVDLTEYSGNKLIKLKTDSPGLLYLADSWYPGWKAYVNGKRVEILKANFNFMAVPIEETGEFIVRLNYQPDSFKFGVIITAASFLVLSLLVFIKYLKKI